MNDGTPKRAPWRFAPRSILTGSGLLSGLGAAVGLAESAVARRGNKERNDGGGDRKDSDNRGNDQQRGDDKQARQRNNDKDENNKNKKDENQQNEQSNKDDRSSRDRGDERQAQKADENGKDRSRDNDNDGNSRQEQRREAKQEAELEQRARRDNDQDDDADNGDSVRHSQSLYQSVDLTQTSPPPVPTTSVDIVSDISNADLVVEGNPEVIAGVSARGGFAFARSGDVTAFTGPDGATIIQSEPVSATSPPPPPPPTTEPDGGDNDTDFAS